MTNEFNPDWRSAPGDTIYDWMEEKQLFVADLSHMIDYPIRETLKLLNGQIIIDQELAETLAKVIGATPEFWLERDRQYRL